jgi:glycosyltransferase involved in cell wall biosynthesis
MRGGGAERVAAHFCNHWVEQGHDVILMPTFSGKGGCFYPIKEQVRLDFLEDRVRNRSHSLFNKILRFFALRRAIHDIKPNVIFSFFPNISVVALLAVCGQGIPVVVSERTYPPAVPLGNLLELLRKIAYPWAATVVVQTQRGLQWLEECCPNTRGRVIPNPVVYPLPCSEPVVDPASKVAGNKRVALAVGRLGEEKGFDHLLVAFGTLATQNTEWDLVILGDGSERQNLERQRDSLGLMGRVHFPGQVGNPGDWYVRADLYVMSSRFEGFPNTLLEAMAHGVPAVSFDCETGPADIIRHGIDGYLVPPSEGADGLARAMETLMRDGAMRQRMGKEALAVRDRFSAQRIMAEWDEVLGLQRSGGDF